MGCHSHSPQFRAAFPGIAYQIGNAISSPAAEIVTSLSESRKITYKVEAFGPAMGIATAIVAVSLAFWTAIGKSRRRAIPRLPGLLGIWTSTPGP